MIRLFKSQERDDTALPGEVLAAIEAANIFVRPGDDYERVIVQPAGYQGFLHDDEAARRFFMAAFPELTEGQLRRAIRYLASAVGRNLRMRAAGVQTKRNWVTDW